ncbi:hypothetical protein [Dissulfurispira thermophila]|uniref:Uncharacterized protein n=1 Tax=hot springs metagenome TaxID=433727 RepID=A0A5J4L1G7_9ZZZZ|nr:hypothetical protein [Dissulfurispira thermophila]
MMRFLMVLVPVVVVMAINGLFVPEEWFETFLVTEMVSLHR